MVSRPIKWEVQGSKDAHMGPNQHKKCKVALTEGMTLKLRPIGSKGQANSEFGKSQVKSLNS